MLTTIICFIVDLFLILPFAAIKLFDKPYSLDDTKPNILLIHGSGNNERQFVLAKGWLGSCYNIHTINLGSEDRTIEEYAQDVSNLIEERQLKSLTLLGISMGGLVSSYYVENLKPDNVVVNKIITIGTPFQGSPLLYVSRAIPWIRMFFSKRYHQMTPESVFLNYLNYQVEISTHEYLTIGSSSDIHVPDAYSEPSNHPAKYQHISLNTPGHLSLPIDRRIFMKICG